MSKPYTPIPRPVDGNFSTVTAWWKVESERILTGCDFVLVQEDQAWAIEILNAHQRGGGRKAVKDWGMRAQARAGTDSPQIGPAKLMPEEIYCTVTDTVRDGGRLTIVLDVYLVDNHQREWESIKARR